MATLIKPTMTGKQLMNAKIAANKANKDEIHSLSFCIKQMKKHGKEYLKACKVSQAQLTPSNLLPYLTEKEQARVSKSQKYSFWLVESLVGRMAKAGAKPTQLKKAA